MTIKRDKQLTAAAGFADPRSFVAPDKREILYGADWKARVEDLRRRSGGQCERIIQVGTGMLVAPLWERCRYSARDPDHIIKRSKARDDRLSNLEALCAYHHEMKHPEFKPRWSRAGRP